jgi:flagellar FliL protein
MPDVSPPLVANRAKNQERKPRRGRGLIIALGLLTLVGGGAAGSYVLVPGVAEMVGGLLPLRSEKPAAAAQPGFIELPEMTVTLANGGRPRQLRLTLALEVSGDLAAVRPEVLTPRLYDALLTYLRTLRDGELEGALAMDRLRGDLFRRVDLLLGPGVLRDVLVTGLVVA